jgi:hypothetical protein
MDIRLNKGELINIMNCMQCEYSGLVEDTYDYPDKTVAYFIEEPCYELLNYAMPLFGCCHVSINDIYYNVVLIEMNEDYVIFRTFDSMNEAYEFSKKYKELL